MGQLVNLAIGLVIPTTSREYFLSLVSNQVAPTISQNQHTREKCEEKTGQQERTGSLLYGKDSNFYHKTVKKQAFVHQSPKSEESERKLFDIKNTYRIGCVAKTTFRDYQRHLNVKCISVTKKQMEE